MQNKDASCYLPGLAPNNTWCNLFWWRCDHCHGQKKLKASILATYWKFQSDFLCQPCHLFTLGAAKAFLRLHDGEVVLFVVLFFFCFYASLRLKPSEESTKSSPLLIHHFAQQWIGIASRWSRVLKNAKFLLFSLFVRPYPCKKSIHDGSTHFFFTCFGQRLIQERWFRSEHREDVWHGRWWYSFGQVASVHLTRSSQTTQCAVVALNGPGKEKTHKKIQIFAITHIQIYHNQSAYQHFLDLPHQHL